jgi:hypothetical protein
MLYIKHSSRLKPGYSGFAICLVVMIGLIGFLPRSGYAGSFTYDNIKFINSNEVANDLFLVFNKNTTFSLKHAKTGKTNVFTTKSNKIKINVGGLPNDFSAKDIGDLKMTGKDVRIDRALSYFTKDNNKINNSVGAITAAPRVKQIKPKLLPSLVEFENYGVQAVRYTNIQVFRNNDISNFVLELFDTPTGDLLGGLPSEVLVNPGETASFEIGVTRPNSYFLVLADAAYALTPDEIFAQGAASSVVPLPGALSLGLSAMAIFGLLGWRKTA